MNIIKTILLYFGLIPTDYERTILAHLRKKESSTMRVIGRGTLTMSAKAARSTEKSKSFMKYIDSIIK